MEITVILAVAHFQAELVSLPVLLAVKLLDFTKGKLSVFTVLQWQTQWGQPPLTVVIVQLSISGMLTLPNANAITYLGSFLGRPQIHV